VSLIDQPPDVNEPLSVGIYAAVLAVCSKHRSDDFRDGVDWTCLCNWCVYARKKILLVNGFESLAKVVSRDREVSRV
jgi:hypothetical protein